MSLHKKTLLVIGAAFAALMIIIIIISKFFILNGFVDLEAEDARINVLRANNEITNMVSSIDSTAGDWALWNDTYEFVRNENPNYIDNNLNVATIKNLGIDFMLFFKSSGGLLHEMYVDPAAREEIPAHGDLLKEVSCDFLVMHSDVDSHKTGIVVVNTTPILMASRPVLKSDFTGPIAGTLIIGKYIDSVVLRELSEKLQLSLTVQAPVPLADQSVGNASSISVRPEGQYKVVGCTVLKDIHGNPALIMKIALPRKIYQQGLTTLHYYWLSIVITGLIFIGLIMLFLEKAVLSPLSWLSARVNRIGASRDFSAKIPVPRNDELGSLSNEINLMLEQIDIGNARLYDMNQSLLAEIEERKQAEEERLKLGMQLRQAHKMESIGTLAGGIAHDFNNILTSVIGYTELALDDVEKGTILEDNLREVYTAGKRAKGLVKQILVFARRSGEETKPIRVDTIVKEVLKLIRSSIPATIEIRQNIESDSLIMADPIQVHQVLINLCTNAMHAMEDEGGTLRVELTDVKLEEDFTQCWADLNPGEYQCLSVSDNGAGIPAELLESIFEPYFTTKDVGKGTGMGLATVHGIVKAYGGEITVESKVGKGTVFSIYLPVIGKALERAEDKLGDVPPGTERILFVDDEIPIAGMGSRVLERLGYSVTKCTGSLEALALFRARPHDFDMVITDMTMPNMTGAGLARELMKIRPDIPVILCTGYSKKLSDASAAEIGVKALVHKPFAREELGRIVREVLDEGKECGSC